MGTWLRNNDWRRQARRELSQPIPMDMHVSEIDCEGSGAVRPAHMQSSPIQTNRVRASITRETDTAPSDSIQWCSRRAGYVRLVLLCLPATGGFESRWMGVNVQRIAALLTGVPSSGQMSLAGTSN